MMQDMKDEILRKAKILIVDDQEDIILILEETLQSQGFSCFKSTPDPRQVLTLFTEFHPDLMILDLLMPHLNGFELMEQLEPLIEADGCLPILVLTGDSGRDAKQKALSGGAKDYLTKPFSPGELLLRIKNLLESRFLYLQLERENRVLEKRVDERTKELAQIQARYQSLVDISPDSIILTDLEGRILFSNHRAAALHGYESSQKMERLSIFDLIAVEDHKMVLEEARKTLETDNVRSCEYTSLRRDGSFFDAEVRASAIQDAQGNPQAFIIVIRDITERKQAEESLKELSKYVLVLQEEERKRVARELHDGVNQILSSIKFRMNALDDKLSVLNESVIKEVVRTKELLDQAIEEVRRISKNLRPSALDNLGLMAAITGLCDDFRERTGKVIELESGEFPMVLSTEMETNLYRFIQEALGNVEKHSGAKKVKIHVSQEGPFFMVAIKDDGSGFKVSEVNQEKTKKRGLGLSHMRERAGIISGALSIQSSPGHGTEITIRIPLRGGEQ
ncbi:MAG: PAS domain S-box protein [Candidatus Tectomicrobia bacterium]|uniref:Oxygen sensor histidine kinase NreB n=1 Tax=Tectimicrobiota bacterium TaxID=2528274 RepID=A0A933GLE4_UNCTE|nr:PAS domain S-box protein [Candidatus Tectomicrobia bacterium]